MKRSVERKLFFCCHNLILWTVFLLQVVKVEKLEIFRKQDINIQGSSYVPETFDFQTCRADSFLFTYSRIQWKVLVNRIILQELKVSSEIVLEVIEKV